MGKKPHAFERIDRRVLNPAEKQIWARLAARIEQGLPPLMREMEKGSWRVVHHTGQLILEEGVPITFNVAGAQPHIRYRGRMQEIGRDKLLAMYQRWDRQEEERTVDRMELAAQERQRRRRLAISQVYRERRAARRGLQVAQIMGYLEALPEMRTSYSQIARGVLGRVAFRDTPERNNDELMARLEEMVAEGLIKSTNATVTSQKKFWVEEEG